MNPKKDDGEGVQFELRFYSGYKGEEIPRAVVIGKREFKIQDVISRQRVLDQATGRKSEVFECRMEGETVKIIRFETGEWEISFPEDS
ncbi:MAG: hypothetical protein PVI11_08225 [Candidatus Aminicenantes bacterium]|jgi:hypothetical protein